jgi:hypothetical protein
MYHGSGGAARLQPVGKRAGWGSTAHARMIGQELLAPRVGVVAGGISCWAGRRVGRSRAAWAGRTGRRS